MMEEQHGPFWVSKHGHLGIDLQPIGGPDGAIGLFSPEEREFANEAFAIWDQVRIDLLKACEAVLVWWKEHEDDTTGEWGEYNVYDGEPPMVALARAAIAKGKVIP